MKTKKTEKLSVLHFELKDKLSESNQGNTHRSLSKTCNCGCLITKNNLRFYMG
jgi:hypothetical protein